MLMTCLLHAYYMPRLMWWLSESNHHTPIKLPVSASRPILKCAAETITTRLRTLARWRADIS